MRNVFFLAVLQNTELLSTTAEVGSLLEGIAISLLLKTKEKGRGKSLSDTFLCNYAKMLLNPSSPQATT